MGGGMGAGFPSVTLRSMVPPGVHLFTGKRYGVCGRQCDSAHNVLIVVHVIRARAHGVFVVRSYPCS